MKQRWNQQEIEFLKKFFNSHGSKYCAIQLNRTRHSVKTQASRLKIIFRDLSLTTKVCRGCYQEKPLSAFSPHTKTPSGLQPRCKQCRAKWESNRKQTDKTYRLVSQPDDT